MPLSWRKLKDAKHAHEAKKQVNSTSILDLADEYNLTFKGESNGEHRYQCPNCDSVDSEGHLYLNPNRETFFCHKCEKGGNKFQLAEFVGIETPRQSYIEQIWEEALPLEEVEDENPASSYLVNRGLDIPRSASLRIHGGLDYDKDTVYPALVARFSNGSLLRTYLAEEGRKADVSEVKRFLGRGMKGHAIRLDEAGDELHLTEGVETALAIRQTLDVPMWACGSAGLLAAVTIPSEVETVHIWSDRDLSEKGQKDARRLAERCLNEGRGAYLHIPPGPTGGSNLDWLDILNRDGGDVTIQEAYRDDEPYQNTGLIRMADVRPESLQFLWQPYIPLKCLTIMAGDPGVGKSLVAVDIAAAVSTGRSLLLGSLGSKTLEQGPVIIFNAEDDVASVNYWRCVAAGADPDKIYFEDVFSDHDSRLKFGGIDFLKNRMSQIEPRLVVIDTLNAYLGGGDVNKAMEIRPVLTALSRLASRFHCAILILHHLVKESHRKNVPFDHRLAGTGDLSGGVRSVLGVGFDPTDYDPLEDNPSEGRRVLVHGKSNNTIWGDSLEFKIVKHNDSIRVQWLGPSNVLPYQIGSQANVPRKVTQIDRAMNLYSSVIRKGPISHVDFMSLLAEETKTDEGIGTSALHQARVRLGIMSVKERGVAKGRWFFMLPEHVDDFHAGKFDLDNPGENSSPGKVPDDQNFEEKERVND
jgi:hypothetical protein